MRRIEYLIAAILFCELIGILGTPVTMAAISTWYASLIKPEFSPPNWIFGPVWTLLYALMGISLYMVWMKVEKKKNNKKLRLALYYFFAQLGVNFLWSIFFFGLRSPILGLIDIAILLVLIVQTMRIFEQISKPAAYLLVPYLLWVSFATVLNVSILLLNP
jgi:translocator protein